MVTAQIGIIGGSGLYQMPELKDIEEVRVETPFGNPSDAFITGTLEAKKHLLPQAAREEWLCFFYHDPEMPLCRVVEEDGKLRAVGLEEKQDGFIPGE